MLGTEPGPSVGAANALNHLPSRVVCLFGFITLLSSDKIERWGYRNVEVEAGGQADLFCEFDANLVYVMSFTQSNQSCTDPASNRKTTKER